MRNEGIKITNNVHKSGKSAKDIMILDKEFLLDADERYVFKDGCLTITVVGGILSASVSGSTINILTSTTGIGVKIYRITKYVYFMITWTGVEDKNARSKKTLKMFRVDQLADIPITLGKGFDICTANSETDINDAFLLAAVNSGDFPNEFMVYRVNQKIATGVCTYYYIYLYMNISTLALTYATSDSKVSWTTIGADTTYDVNLPYGQDIENSYAYILRKTISNDSVLVYYLLSRNEGVLTKTPNSSIMGKINGKLDSGYAIIALPNQEFNVGYLNESTGDITSEVIIEIG